MIRPNTHAECPYYQLAEQLRATRKVGAAAILEGEELDLAIRAAAQAHRSCRAGLGQEERRS